MKTIFVDFYLTEEGFKEKVKQVAMDLVEAMTQGHDGNKRYYTDELRRLNAMTAFRVVE